jgi:peptidoglycan/xylan/chitin deacetylase (PgdA/CDA1 family)
VSYKEGFLTRPVVNEYMDLLWEWIDSFNLGFKRKKFWNGKDFAACLTHDIDAAEKWSKSGLYGEARHWGAIALKERKPLSTINRMAKAMAFMLNSDDPYWNFDRIMNMEKQYGFSSSFYFFGGGRHKLDARYSVEDGKISTLLSEIQSRGHEVGLHGSFDSYSKLEMLRSEKENLEKVAGEIFSIRQHYLRFDTQKTFDIYEKLGIKCDVTLGFAAHEGFRAGICLPFYPYNLEEDRPFDVLEIPLTIMDGTLSDAKYRGLNAEEAWQSVKSLLETVKRQRGCIVLLWHNTHLDRFESADFAEVYERTLYWIACNNGLGLSAKQICRD